MPRTVDELMPEGKFGIGTFLFFALCCFFLSIAASADTAGVSRSSELNEVEQPVEIFAFEKGVKLSGTQVVKSRIEDLHPKKIKSEHLAHSWKLKIEAFGSDRYEVTVLMPLMVALRASGRKRLWHESSREPLGAWKLAQGNPEIELPQLESRYLYVQFRNLNPDYNGQTLVIHKLEALTVKEYRELNEK